MPKRRSIQPNATADKIVVHYQDIAKHKFQCLTSCVVLFLVGIFAAGLAMVFFPVTPASPPPVPSTMSQP